MLIAFLPAAVVGALAHSFIKEVLFNLWIVCFTLIVGGAILLWVDQLDLEPRYHDATRFTLPMYLVIGLAQCVSMIPGVSRSGATIVSAMLLGADRRSAAEFSFWLAMPTMAGAFAYDLYKSRAQMSMRQFDARRGRLRVSFICAWIVVKTFLGYVRAMASRCSPGGVSWSARRTARAGAGGIRANTRRFFSSRRSELARIRASSAQRGKDRSNGEGSTESRAETGAE